LYSLARNFLSFLYFRENGRLNLALNSKDQNKTKSRVDDGLNHHTRNKQIQKTTNKTMDKNKVNISWIIKIVIAIASSLLGLLGTQQNETQE